MHLLTSLLLIPVLGALLIALPFNQANINGMGIPDGLIFDYPSLLNNPLPAELQTARFFLLLGFAVKAPVFPLHTWLQTIAMEEPASIAAIMTGLKLGAQQHGR